MKNIIYICSCLIVLTFFSCEKGFDDFLDKAPGVDVTEDTIFSSQVQLETLITGIYSDGLPVGYPYKVGLNLISGNVINSGGAADEGDVERSWYPSNDWNTADIGPGSIMWHEDSRYNLRWSVIRRINILLERIDEVPDLDPSAKDQMIGEALFIRALNYFEMFKRYGGFPIVNKRFLMTDDLAVGRSSVDSCVNFIIKDCDDAAKLLPPSNLGIMRGRATEGCALMVKSKTLLFAASPLFNTATPYLSLGDKDKLICYTNEDRNRWQLAADAAKAVIDWAPSGGCVLVTDQGTDKNYKYVWEQTDNEEIILADKSLSQYSHDNMLPWGSYVPAPIYNGQAGVSIPMNFIKKYEKKDGTKQTWAPVGGEGIDLNQKYDELDPRFKQSIAYNGAYWNVDYPIVETFEGGAHTNRCLSGAWLRKGVPDALTRETEVIVNWTIFRLAEAYLNYAEALNEAVGPVPEAYEAVNIIRSRSGMPDLPAGLTLEEFRERVRNERAIELFFEDHRFWDIRRWLIAEDDGVMQGDFVGLKIYEIPSSTEFRYEPYVFEVRSFKRKMYLHPYLESEVNKGYIIENPGYIR